MKKYTRQTKILELISKREIETQEELAEGLKAMGIDVTQATISRDIKELRLVKVMSKSGKYKYATIGQSQEGITDRLYKIFENSVVSIDNAMNIIVLKTIPGAAQICASAIDYMGVDEIVGTLAGDDTVFVAIRSLESVEYVLDEFKKNIRWWWNGDSMLLNLSISNFAVFENEYIKFDKGFNVFTGETGSGKSVLIEALSLILGERASKDLIRKGKTSAIIEAVFDISDYDEVHNKLKQLSIEIDTEDYLIVSREILDNGKSISKINGRTLPLSTIKEVGSYLIDIYGQFGHESLFKKENHILLLDSLIQKDLNMILSEYSKLYSEYNKKLSEIDFLQNKLVNKDVKIEQLQYEINEIDEADIKEAEEDELLKVIKKLSNIKEIQNSLYEANNILDSSNGLNNVYSILNKLKSYDESLENFLSRLDIILEEIQFFNYDLRQYSEKMEYDENQLDKIESRMSLVNRLKRKYGFTIDKIIEYRNASENELLLLKDAEYKLNNLIKEKNVIYNKLKEYSEKLSDKRKNAAEILETKLLNELNDLNMKNINFKVNIERKNNFSSDGIDDVEFLIATNLGSDLNSVQKVVSGGEASRIMLAFKKISSEIESTQTLIFDEIDSGISGKTAQMAGIKMNYISDNHQVICVTHSPQIASISKNHFLIEKRVLDNNTYSTVQKLDDENKVYEIARLLSGMKITEKSLNNAKDLIDSSKA